MKILRILRAGPLSTLQDLGRGGYGQYGVPTAGAMDPWALQIGNLLVGNPRNSPGLEMTIQGIKAQILSRTVLTITGGTGVYTLNGQSVENWRTFPVEPGDVLDIGVITEGCRAYLIASGGLDVNMILGSGSTYLPASLGGMNGRALVREDILSAVPKSTPQKRPITRFLVPELVPHYPDVCTLRVVPGLHEELFSRETLDLFYSTLYVVTPQSNRMGYRLQGRALNLAKGAALISDAVVFGVVQVPPDGQPIILAADHQTTGGYPVIGVVASVDFSSLAQLRPGQSVRFRSIDLEEAQSLRREQERLLSTLALA
ncbi:biotin-dependent carboxyltransferase family protein [Desulfosporosinus metallidurans]|uniref:Allophanate hydrolase 2 subunit 2 n=1 Tax=Desulfosporosinus metallidurans TaxID=1888891 RepID=A0A1Q8QX72_9FIRM|nr:biotin-dependent carboxyltransferase family protein [Desulfosporosinus metallidurans]OLN31931.1 Allophanate hydrolase 2 subunit 2 [Desulfosporosinus metallidurans]